MARRDSPESPMTVHDWERLARVARREAQEWALDGDDATMERRYLDLARKCDYRAEELAAGRVVP
jgi:hypothetical protein